jgi:nitrogen regulatory protein PII
MDQLNLLVTVTDRGRLSGFMDLYKQLGIRVNLVALGKGTARSEMLDYLGLEGSEKAVCFSFVTGKSWPEVRRGLTLLGIDGPGAGVAFTVPLSSIGGVRELRFLTEGQNYEKDEESSLKDTTNELLVIIANQGYTEQVMDAAREQGAGGGTVIHAKGTGMQQADKFFGMTLAAEKDVIYIVTRREQKNQIMKAVMEKAGVGTKAGAIVFSLPVTATAGMRQLEEQGE